MNLPASFVGIAGFVITVLTVCGAAYIHADRLQAWAKRQFGKQRKNQRGGN